MLRNGTNASRRWGFPTERERRSVFSRPPEEGVDDALTYFGSSAKIFNSRRLDELERIKAESRQQSVREYHFFSSVIMDSKIPICGIRWAMQRLRNLALELGYPQEQIEASRRIGLRAICRKRAIAIIAEAAQVKADGRKYGAYYIEKFRTDFRRAMRRGRLTLADIGVSEKKLRSLGWKKIPTF